MQDLQLKIIWFLCISAGGFIILSLLWSVAMTGRVREMRDRLIRCRVPGHAQIKNAEVTKLDGRKCWRYELDLIDAGGIAHELDTGWMERNLKAGRGSRLKITYNPDNIDEFVTDADRAAFRKLTSYRKTAFGMFALIVAAYGAMFILNTYVRS